MMPEQHGPGALAGAAEAGTQCFGKALSTSPKSSQQPARDGRTRLGRAFRNFSALPEGYRAQILLRRVRPANGGVWTARQAAERTGVPAELLMLMLMTSGGPEPLAAAIIEEMGRGGHLIVVPNKSGRLVLYRTRSSNEPKWLLERVSELHPSDDLVVRLRMYATVPIDKAGELLGATPECVLERLNRHELGGLSIDGLPFVSRLSLGRRGASAAKGLRE